METTQPVPEENNLLYEFETRISHQTASKGIRFANLVLDMLAFYACLFLTGIGLGLYAVTTNDDSILNDNNFTEGRNFLISCFIYLLYFTLAEGITKGRSIGKLITGTVAVREDGSAFTWKDALLRSLSRIVPFEPFSALGYAPWHDTWTRTTVIKKMKR